MENNVGCIHLDYDEEKYQSCSLEYRSDGVKFWLRPVSDEDLPTHVQFCKLRGRLNHWEACISKEKAMCSDYKEK